MFFFSSFNTKSTSLIAMSLASLAFGAEAKGNSDVAAFYYQYTYRDNAGLLKTVRPLGSDDRGLKEHKISEEKMTAWTSGNLKYHEASEIFNIDVSQNSKYRLYVTVQLSRSIRSGLKLLTLSSRIQKVKDDIRSLFGIFNTSLHEHWTPINLEQRSITHEVQRLTHEYNSSNEISLKLLEENPTMAQSELRDKIHFALTDEQPFETLRDTLVGATVRCRYLAGIKPR